ncbi:MAG: hypothetical protein KDC98_10355 [Planctomycetes bacterium]|nr:hypothetical protein [Planctomycetota bacterium]
MLPLFRSISLLTGLLIAAAAVAQEDPSAPPVLRAPESITRTPLAELREAYGGEPGVVERDGWFCWHDQAGDGYELFGRSENNDALLHTRFGTVQLDYFLVCGGEVEKLEQLLLPLGAETARTEPIVVERNPLLGIAASDDGAIKSRDWVGRAESIAAPADLSTRLEAIAAAADLLMAAAPVAAWPELAHDALASSLHRAAMPGFGEDDLDGDADPAMLRRMIANGWLRAVVGGAGEQVAAVEAAVAAAMRFEPVRRFRRDQDSALTELQNACGDTGWRLSGADRLRVAFWPPMAGMTPLGIDFPMWSWLALDLPNGSDPFVDPAAVNAATSARLSTYGTELVSWDADAGLVADDELWRTVVDLDHIEGAARDSAPRNYLPPHLVLADPHGGVHVLHTRHGALRAAAGAGDEARFLADAARVLPDPAHVDLIGQYLFSYVSDSPDPTRPRLVGTARACGEIHQTAAQTLAMSRAGVCRGDCDDLAELLVEVLRTQGRAAHVVGTRAHLLAMTATEPGDEWIVHVLQTGPAGEYRAATLVEALAAAIRDHDDEYVFDPSEISLPLRFSNENTREDTYQDHRVFSSPAYAADSRAVEEALHCGFHGQAIDRLEQLMARHGRGNGELVRLAMLWSRSGDHARAVQLLEEAGGLAEYATSKIWCEGYLAAALAEAGRNEAAMAAIERLIVAAPQALAEERELARVNVAVSVAETMAMIEAWPEFGRLVEALVLPDARRLLVELRQRLENDDSESEDEAAFTAEALGLPQASTFALTSQLTSMVGLLLECAERPECGRPGLERSIRDVLGRWSPLALLGIEDDGELLMQLGNVARAHRVVLGSEVFEAKLAATEPARSGRPPTVGRVLGLTQVRRDLPWLHAAVGMRVQDIERHLGRGHRVLDREALDRDFEALHRAADAARTLGLKGPVLEDVMRTVELVQALLIGDVVRIRERFVECASRDDKQLRDLTCGTVALTAGLLPAADFGRALELWAEHAATRATWFVMAYGVLDTAPERALAVAERACSLHPDDAEMAAELAFFRGRVEAALAGKSR